MIVACALRLPSDAFTVAVPEFWAVSTGGSSVESVSTKVLSTVQVAPVTSIPFWSAKASVRSAPSSIAAVEGVRVSAVTGEVTVTVAENDSKS